MLERVPESSTVTASAVTNIAEAPNAERISLPIESSVHSNSYASGIVAIPLPEASGNVNSGRRGRKQTFGDFDVDRSILSTSITGGEKIRFMLDTREKILNVPK